MRFSVVLLGVASAAIGGAASAQSGQAIGLQGRGVALDMSLSAGQPDRPQVGGQASLTGQLDQLQTRLELGAQGGQPAPVQGASDSSSWWNTTSAGVGATWIPFGAAKVELAARNATRVDFTASDPVFGDAGQHFAQHRTSGVTASATLTPIAPLDLKFGANLSTDLEQTASIAGSGVESHDQVQTEQRQMSAGLAWRPLSAVTVEASGRMQATNLVWAAGRAAAYAGLDPEAKLSVTPWSGGSLRLTAGRSTSPVTQSQFLGYDPGGPEFTLPEVQPNREWRYGAVVSQKAGPVDFSASLIQARVQSFAYLAPSGAVGARVGMGQGDRRELHTNLTAPLPLFGFSSFRLEAQATVRDSSVQDPLTGVLGRMSGEQPYDASLSLSHGVGGGVRWGVTAKASGPQVNLGPTEVANLSSTAGLGGFLQYQTRPVTVRLSLDNLIGGERSEHDVIYDGLRDLNVVDHATSLRTVDRGFHISLIRPL
jgi:hypothetical protein